jgi:hypothetical protein
MEVVQVGQYSSDLSDEEVPDENKGKQGTSTQLLPLFTEPFSGKI